MSKVFQIHFAARTFFLGNTVVPRAVFDETVKTVVKLPGGTRAVNRLNTKIMAEKQDMFNSDPAPLT